jgi:hypothetical protein
VDGFIGQALGILIMTVKAYTIMYGVHQSVSFHGNKKMNDDSITLRSAHIQNCKNEAYVYLDKNDFASAWAAFYKDMKENKLTENHPALVIGMHLVLSGHITTIEQLRKHIDGYR